MKTKTYALNPGRDSRYNDMISGYKNELITEAEEALIPVVKGLIFHQYTNNKEDLRSSRDYLSDFILIGDLWNEFILNKFSYSAFEYRKFLFLYSLNRNSFLKNTSFFNIVSAGFPGKKLSLSKVLKNIKLSDFEELIIRVKSSGKFEEEIKRLELIYNYLAILHADYINYILNKIICLSLWLTYEGKGRNFKALKRESLNNSKSRIRNKKAAQNILTGREIIQAS
jgi:hypothetical protein